MKLRQFLDHRTASQDLIRLVVGPELPARRAQRTTHHLRECAVCRQRYGLLRQKLAAEVGIPELASTASSRSALFEHIMDSAEVSQSAARQVPWPWVARAALVTATLAALLVVPRMWSDSTSGPGEFASRGGVETLPDAGLGVSAVDEDGHEYEAVHGEGVCATHTLKFYARIRDAQLRYLFLLAVQADSSEPTWVFPGEPGGLSLEIPDTSSPWMLPEEVPLELNHHPGVLVLIAGFSTEPQSMEELEKEWDLWSGRDRDAAQTSLLWMQAMARRGFVMQQTAVDVVDCEGGIP